MEKSPSAQIQKGTLLIASPDIESGLLFRGVMLVCEHNPGGSFGILINKELELDLPEEIINLSETKNPNIQLRAGGPVQTNQMMLLHTQEGAEKRDKQTLQICDGVYLGGDLKFLQEVIQDPEGPHVHLCFGYAGWTPGQLEREFLDGQWFIHPASYHYLFEVPPENLWKTLLQDMGGKYAPLSMIPEDLSLN